MSGDALSHDSEPAPDGGLRATRVSARPAAGSIEAALLHACGAGPAASPAAKRWPLLLARRFG